MRDEFVLYPAQGVFRVPNERNRDGQKADAAKAVGAVALTKLTGVGRPVQQDMQVGENLPGRTAIFKNVLKDRDPVSLAQHS